MSIDQEPAWAETVNNNDTVLEAPHLGDDGDQELADLLNDILTEEDTSEEEDHPDSEAEVEGNNPEGEGSDWEIDVTSDEYENINNRAQRRYLNINFNVRNPDLQETIGVTFNEKKKCKKSQSDADEHPWEAHIWVNNVNLGEHEEDGMQIFLGNYKTEQQAQEAHDSAAIFFKKTGARGLGDYTLNFRPSPEQEQVNAELADWLVRDFTWCHRRWCGSFCRSKVVLKGVTEGSSRGKQWFEAKISWTGRSKNNYRLGRFDTKEEAARAYDLALLYCHRCEGAGEMIQSVVTNFRPSLYTNAEIREAGRKMVPKPEPQSKVREAKEEMNMQMYKKMRIV